MRKSILVTAAIAVTAVGLALVLSQTTPGQVVLGKLIQPKESAQENLASTVTATPETTTTTAEVQEVTPATTETTAAAETTTPETTSTAPTTEETAATEPAGGMTPVNLDAAQERLNAETPAAGEETAAPKTEATEAVAKEPTYKVDVAAALKDRSIGSADAPLTIYDFSSLTCPHCGHFHKDILPKIKQYYIDTGKVRWVFKGFPLNEPALKAEMLARCAPADQYIKLIDLMYENQERWAFGENALGNLSMFLRLAGISDDMFRSCTTNVDLQTAYVKQVQDNAEKYKIESTPTFVFNDGVKSFSGASSYEGFAYDIDAVLKQIEDKKATPATTQK